MGTAPNCPMPRGPPHGAGAHPVHSVGRRGVRVVVPLRYQRPDLRPLRCGGRFVRVDRGGGSAATAITPTATARTAMLPPRRLNEDPAFQNDIDQLPLRQPPAPAASQTTRTELRRTPDRQRPAAQQELPPPGWTRSVVPNWQVQRKAPYESAISLISPSPRTVCEVPTQLGPPRRRWRTGRTASKSLTRACP
jgi:hypothetical protein